MRLMTWRALPISPYLARVGEQLAEAVGGAAEQQLAGVQVLGARHHRRGRQRAVRAAHLERVCRFRERPALLSRGRCLLGLPCRRVVENKHSNRDQCTAYLLSVKV